MSDRKDFMPTFTHVTERDIDVLLVEELKSSPEFLQWIALKVGWDGKIYRSEVLHSKRRTRNRREIDIHVEIYTETELLPIVILIENKLDACEQPDQAESYREELEEISSNSAHGFMLLVCPSDYSNIHNIFSEKFDRTIHYEEIIIFLDKRLQQASGELKSRLQFRKELFEQALHKYRRGYTPILNSAIGDFNSLYVNLLAKMAPDIAPGPSMLKKANPNESVSMIFDHNKSLDYVISHGIPIRRFAHEFGKNQGHRANYVSVAFAGWGKHWNEIKDHLVSDTLDYGFSFSSMPPTKNRPNPALIMSIETCPVDNQADFASQVPYLEMGIRSAIRLRNWLHNNVSNLQKWHGLIDNI